MNLQRLGWNESHARAFTALQTSDAQPARVVREDRERYRIDTGSEHAAEIAGRLRHQARNRLDFPAVGDWVAARAPEGQGPWTITAVLPRSSVFVRQAAGGTTEPQVVAANIDTVFVVAGLDADFNVRRLERYVTAAWESGARPLIVLNKSDLARDIGQAIGAAAEIAPGVPVVALSAAGRQGLDALEPWLVPQQTVALLGSSGAGKSTLVNALLGHEVQATQDVRASDSHGRHTTTHRELLVLPGGAILIDTPGMRALQLWTAEPALDGTFPEVAALAAQCRFADCAHENEPGCAVLAAEAAGELPADRLASWRKLQRELRHLALKQDDVLRRQEEARWKAIHKSLRTHPKYRDRRDGGR